MPQSDGGIKGN